MSQPCGEVGKLECYPWVVVLRRRWQPCSGPWWMSNIPGNITNNRHQEGSQRETRALRSSLTGGAGLRAFWCVDQAWRKTRFSKGVHVVSCLVDCR